MNVSKGAPSGTLIFGVLKQGLARHVKFDYTVNGLLENEKSSYVLVNRTPCFLGTRRLQERNQLLYTYRFSRSDHWIEF